MRLRWTCGVWEGQMPLLGGGRLGADELVDYS